MEFNTRYLLIVGIVFCGLISSSFGHSYVTSPQSRTNQKQTQSGCRGPACLGPCDAPLSSMRGVVATHQRGDQITVQWPRNNHAGGFIRFAWAKTAQSDDASAFDTHVQQINCHEVGGCGPSDPANPNGGDNGAGDGSYKPCQQNITVPGDLTDGGWTLQWAWFGGAFALGDYYSCVDLSISGGASSALVPAFIGGDYAYPNQQKCKFFNTDRLHVCTSEPCNNPIYPASQQESGMPAYIQKNADGSLILANSSTPVVAPVAPVAPVTSTSSSSSTSSTSSSTSGVRSSTSTTSGRVSTSSSSTSSTSSSAAASSRVPVATSTSSSSSSSSSAPRPASSTSSSSTSSRPTSTSTSASSVPSTANCGQGDMKCLTSETFSMCLYGLWGPSMECAPGTTCQQAGSVIQCGWPIN